MSNQGAPAEAAAQFAEAIALRDDNVRALSGLAWIRATASDPSLRDAVEAIRMAERADNLASQQDVTALDGLSAAYAAAGRFEDAVRVARAGLILATAAGQVNISAQFSQRIELYQKGQPLRIPEP